MRSAAIIKFVTVEAVQNEAAAKWDVDISDDIVRNWLPQLKESTKVARTQWACTKRSYHREISLYGIPNEWDDILDEPEEFVGAHINQFLYARLGKPAYFDANDVYVPSEYVQQHGKVYSQ